MERDLTQPRAIAVDSAGEFAALGVAETLQALVQRMYTIGETTGQLTHWDTAVAQAAFRIVERGREPGATAELTAEVSGGMGPLAFAGSHGYHAVVEVLLRFDPVRATLEQPGAFGLTPWQLANLAPDLTLMVINPSTRGDPFRLVPYIVKLPYYADVEFSPYHRTRRLLAEAGAAQASTAVKAFLDSSAVCPPAVKQAVRDSDDVLTTLRHIVRTDATHGMAAVLADEPR